MSCISGRNSIYVEGNVSSSQGASRSLEKTRIAHLKRDLKEVYLLFERRSIDGLHHTMKTKLAKEYFQTSSLLLSYSAPQ